MPVGDVAIGLIPDLLSRGTATVLRVFVVIPSLLHPTKIAVYVCGPIRGSCLIGSVVEGVFYWATAHNPEYSALMEGRVFNHDRY